MTAWFRAKDREPVQLPDDLAAEVRELRATDRVAAVKLVRERTGAGLEVATRAVDALD